MEKRSMKHHAGLDVSVKESSICIVDETGKVCREMKVLSHPEDLLQALKDPAWQFERVGGLRLAPYHRASGGGPAGRLHRDPAHEGFPQSSGEQKRSK
jgi:hypothetical protein